MIRLSFGSIPRKVIIKLGKSNNLTYETAQKPRAVSCIWDSRLRSRPKLLKLATRSPNILKPRMSNYHGRYIYT
ncbi:MAG: hypothetical protein OCC46_12740 [Pseudodesulfovibrio sp.]